MSEEYIFYGKPPSREFAALTARKDSILGLSIVRWDISLALNMTYFLFPIGTSCLAMKVKIKKENGGELHPKKCTDKKRLNRKELRFLPVF